MNENRRILVIANETVEGDVLHETIRFNAGEEAGVEVLVVAPALNSRVRHWLSDEDEARRRAELRLAACVERLAAAGIEVTGRVGDADPLQAIQDALHLFAADVIIIATHPEGRSHWLARNVVQRARLRFPQSIRHVVVDVRDRQEVAAA
jgi:nucleotide-binding universal stress UspA family protein